jgi:hypothetical protein
MKNNLLTILIIVAVVVALGIYAYSQSGSNSTISNLLSKVGISDRGNNGWYNSETKECWSTPTSLNGGKQKGGVACCFDSEGYQVDCNNADKRLSNIQQVFALYWTDYPTGTETPGMFTRAQSIGISNPSVSGAVPLDDVWISSAVWTSSNSAGNTILNNAYARLTANGSSNQYSGPIAVGGTQLNFPALPVDLQALDSGSGTVYTLTLMVNSMSYSGQLNGSQTITKVMKVTKQSVGFNVTMTW